jgi:hypothetical protein
VIKDIRVIDVAYVYLQQRLINGGKVNTEGTAASLNKVMDFYLSTTRRLVSVMSLRQVGSGNYLSNI